MPIQFPNASMLARAPDITPPLSYADHQKNALGDLVLQKEQQGLDTQNAMKQIFAQPGALGQDGIPTPQTINALYALNPEVGTRVSTLAESSRHRKVQEQEWVAQAQERKQKMFMDNAAKVLTFYERAVQNTGDDAKARQQTDAYVGELHNEMLKSDSTLGPRPEPFDPDKWYPKVQNAQLLAAERVQGRVFTQQEAIQKMRDAAAEVREDRRDARTAASEDRRDARANARLAAALGGDGGGGKPLTEMAKLNADLKAGRITQAQYDSALTGKGDDRPLTEMQAKGTAYAGMMTHATATQDRLRKEGFTGETLPEQIQVTNAMGDGIPYVPGTGIIQRSAASNKAQEAAQAQMLWAEAALRFQTGAAATKEEIIRTSATFFPRSGDRPEVVKQKAEARRAMEESVRITAGRGAAKIPAMPSKAGASGEWKIELVK